MSCVHFLVIINKVGMRIHVQVVVSAYIVISLGLVLTSTIAGLHSHCMLINCQAVFQSGSTIFHSHWQSVNDSLSLPPCQYLVLSQFLILVIMLGI